MNNKILLQGVEPSVQIVFDQLLDDVFSRLTLINFMQLEMDQLSKRIENALSENEFLDIELAQSLFQQSQQLLELCIQKPKEEFVPYVLAAVQYLIDEDDGNADFDGVDGFEDDKQVIDQVINQFDLEQQLQNLKNNKLTNKAS